MRCFGLDDDCILWIILLLALFGVLNDERRGVLGTSTRDKDCCC